MRIVAAVWVVVFHFHFTALPGVAEVADRLGPLITQGALGVDLFFVLSGFVIAWTHLDRLGPRLRVRDSGRFLWARAARMWPAYAVVLHLFGVWLVARAVLGPDGRIAYQAVQPSLDAGTWLQQLLLVHMWDEPYLDGASWVGPTWSISAEWLAYLLFPLLAVAFHRLRNLPFAALAAGSLLCVAPVAAAFVVVGSPYYPYSWLVRILGGFSAGVLAMLAVRRLRGTAGWVPATRAAEPRVAGRPVAAAASWTATFTAVAIPVLLVPGSGYGAAAAVLLFPVLVGALALADRGPVHHLLTRAAVVHGGRISYALYLVHIPMFEILWFLGDRGLVPDGGVTGHLIALAVLAGTLPAAHLLYALVECPARRWMRARPVAGAAVRTAVDRSVDSAPVATDDARCDPVTAVLPRIGSVTSSPSSPSFAPAASFAPAGSFARATSGASFASSGTGPATAAGQRSSGPGTGPQPTAPVAEPQPTAPVAEPEPTTPASEPAPDEPVVVPAPAVPIRDPRRREEPAVAPAASGPGDRFAAARSAGTRAPGSGVATDLAAVARRRDLAVADAERAERLHALRNAVRPVADGAGHVVPAPRAIRSASALPGTRSGVENCGRGGRHRDAHASAATPIVAASGVAGRRRRKRPAHGA
nr:acyltransferase family protein [Pseudonocardia sp. C8]